VSVSLPLLAQQVPRLWCGQNELKNGKGELHREEEVVSEGRRGEGEQVNVPIGDCAFMKIDGRLDGKARIDAAPTGRSCDTH
jgi:hypothetical protein